MQVVDLNGKTHKWVISSYAGVKRNKCSSLHLRARTILTNMFPFDMILEEVALPGTKLFLDFYIHSRRLAVEAHGKQHYEYTPMFHDSEIEFRKSKTRDNQKKEWLTLNDITLIELPYTENDNEWESRIRNG
jgi:hypothetical protein